VSHPMARMMRLTVAALLVVAAHAIYPDDHWTFSTELTKDNHVDHIKSVVDSGKTLFVRAIASAG